MIPVRTLVLVCDDRAAALYENRGVGKGLDEVERLAAGDVIGAGPGHDDRPGRGQSAPGQARHGYRAARDDDAEARHRFAVALAERLERRAKNLDRVGIVAAPRMLGALRASLGGAVRGKLAWEVDKDLTHKTARELREILGDVAAF